MATFYFYDEDDRKVGSVTGVDQDEADRLALSWGWRVADPAELEEEVQQIAGELTNDNEKFKALAFATVDLRMADITGLTQAEVRQRFKDRVIFYLREQRGI
jgi:hypothetical protein